MSFLLNALANLVMFRPQNVYVLWNYFLCACLLSLTDFAGKSAHVMRQRLTLFLRVRSAKNKFQQNQQKSHSVKTLYASR